MIFAFHALRLDVLNRALAQERLISATLPAYLYSILVLLTPELDQRDAHTLPSAS